MAMQSQLVSAFRPTRSAPPAGFAGHLPTAWGGVGATLHDNWGGVNGPSWSRASRPTESAPPAGFAGHLPTAWGGVRAGRRLGELVLGRGVRLGKGSACLSLGRGTQPAGSWATICCVPGQVITPNVVVVKAFATIKG